ncbi:hypothetical protein Tsubulata_016451 [Turnera subulata]|uniref:Uncharacterized protein n=1 Tax=Turnera subulata TaxID=218843 RepID=A0A9Q0GAG0_9ROSI|nr:hypothetical protein Tsubulata_016451 [Turnera subulata]
MILRLAERTMSTESSHPTKKFRNSKVGVGGGEESEPRKGEQGGEDKKIEPEQEEGGGDEVFEPKEKFEETGEEKKEVIVDFISDYYLKSHPYPRSDPTKPKRKYLGSLEEGATFNTFWRPPLFLLEKENPISKAILYDGAFVAPTSELLEKFLACLDVQYQKILRTYFETIKDSMGFEVPDDLPSNSSLPYMIIRPYYQYRDPKRPLPLEDICPKIISCVQLALSWINIMTNDKYTLVQDVECANVKGVESVSFALTLPVVTFRFHVSRATNPLSAVFCELSECGIVSSASHEAAASITLNPLLNSGRTMSSKSSYPAKKFRYSGGGEESEPKTEDGGADERFLLEHGRAGDSPVLFHFFFFFALNGPCLYFMNFRLAEEALRLVLMSKREKESKGKTVGEPEKSEPRKEEQGGEDKKIEPEQEEGGGDEVFEPKEKFEETGEEKKEVIVDFISDYYLKSHPYPRSDPTKPKRKYLGSLEEGATFNTFWRPPLFLLEKENPISKAILYDGAFVAPSRELLEKFLACLDVQHQKILRTYFETIKDSMGFEVPNDLPSNSSLPFPVIRPYYQYLDPKRPLPLEDICPKIISCVQLALSWINIMTNDKYTLVQDVECANVQGVETVNVYFCGRDLFFLTFTATSLSTGQRQTFQAVMECETLIRWGGDLSEYYRYLPSYIRLKPQKQE